MLSYGWLILAPNNLSPKIGCWCHLFDGCLMSITSSVSNTNHRNMDCLKQNYMIATEFNNTFNMFYLDCLFTFSCNSGVEQYCWK